MSWFKTRNKEQETAALEEASSTIAHHILALDPLVAMFAKQRLELLNKRTLIGGVKTPADLQDQITINQSVLSYLNMLRMVATNRQGKKLLGELTKYEIICSNPNTPTNIKQPKYGRK